MAQARYYFLCAGSGLIWSGIAYLLLASFDSGVLGWRIALRELWFFPGLWGGILVSPFIGLLIGLVHRPTYAFPLILRVVLALASLYAAAALFGVVIGIVEEVIETSPNHVKGASIIEWVLATLWGVTFTGYFLFLWPMAFANHWLLGRAWRGEWTRKDSLKAALFIFPGVGVGGLVAALLWLGGAAGI